MTREEALEILDRDNDSMRKGWFCINDFLAIEELKKLAREQEPILDKIRAEILDCLKALDEIEKSGLKIYLPNEISGRRLTYEQCLEFIDKYKAEDNS